MAIELPALPYPRNALEPHLSAATLDEHHGSHHRGHVEATNRLLEGSGLEGLALEEIVRRARGRLADEAAQAWSHGFYWTCLSPRGGGDPAGPLAERLARQYGDFIRFREEFTRQALGLFGSGWVWLLVKSDGALAIASTPNQDNPLMDVAEVKGTPILGNDVWEHAYYLEYQNRRAAYLDGWWQVVDWKTVSDRYAATRAR